MRRVADFYYEMSDRELWLACQQGDVGAGIALIERHDGRPPGEGAAGLSPAAVWAAILSGAAAPPALTRPSAPADEKPASR